jgi:hypothetical protein
MEPFRPLVQWQLLEVVDLDESYNYILLKFQDLQDQYRYFAIPTNLCPQIACVPGGSFYAEMREGDDNVRFEPVDAQMDEEALDKFFSDTTDQKPAFYKAAERRAAELGIPVKELLDSDREAAIDCEIPTLSCLDPWEIQFFVTGKEAELDPSSISHVNTCNSCAALVAVAKKLKNPDP